MYGEIFMPELKELVEVSDVLGHTLSFLTYPEAVASQRTSRAFESASELVCRVFHCPNNKLLHRLAKEKPSEARNKALEIIKELIKDGKDTKPLVKYMGQFPEIFSAVFPTMTQNNYHLQPPNFLFDINYHFETTLALIPYLFSPLHIGRLFKEPINIANMVFSLKRGVNGERYPEAAQRIQIEAAIIASLVQCQSYLSSFPVDDYGSKALIAHFSENNRSSVTALIHQQRDLALAGNYL